MHGLTFRSARACASGGSTLSLHDQRNKPPSTPISHPMTRNGTAAMISSAARKSVASVGIGRRGVLRASIGYAARIDRSVVVAINGRDENFEKSARNIDRTTLTTVSQLNAWDILRNRTLVLTRDGLAKLLA